MTENLPYETRFETRGGFKLAGMRRQFTADTRAMGIPALWADFRPHIGKVTGEFPTRTYGAIGESRPDGYVDYMACIEVDDFGAVDLKYDRMIVPDQNYLVVTHRGHISEIGKTWEWIFTKWPASIGKEIMTAYAMTPEFEIYDHRYDQVSGEGEVDIWVPVLPDVMPG